ncbi:MAG: chemotaxis protein CheB [Chloroflexi bacterium]|nr:chemotaxis protein CheB [Chloroflexota bacterium]
MSPDSIDFSRDVIVIGASAGGVEALFSLMAQLPADIPAAIFIVLHTPNNTPSHLPQILNRVSALPAKIAVDGETIRPGQIYLAPADYHMMVKANQVRVVHGPRENLWRPAIDPLFRSAAVTHGARVIGVILTGMMDDGAAGLLAVKRCGGCAVVQTPADATFPEMPTNALAQVQADYILPLAEMGAMLDRLAREPAGESPAVPEELWLENQIVERMTSHVEQASQLGDQVPVSCPECGGPLWEMKTIGTRRYRCSIGHAYTAQTLVADQTQGIEQALWYALRTLEERSNMLKRMAGDEEGKGRQATAKLFHLRADESQSYAIQLRKLLQEAFITQEANVIP